MPEKSYARSLSVRALDLRGEDHLHSGTVLQSAALSVTPLQAHRQATAQLCGG